jgi:hypothetical protein
LLCDFWLLDWNLWVLGHGFLACDFLQ